MKPAAGAKTEMAIFTALEPVSYMGPIAEDTTRGHLQSGLKFHVAMRTNLGDREG
jgi:hypothetical protein